MKSKPEHEEDEIKMEKMIGLFKKVAENPVSNRLLQRTLGYCEKDKSTKLESSLNYYLEKKDDVCKSCKLLSKIVGYIIEKGAVSFNVSTDELKEKMEDEYWVKGLASVIKGITIFKINKPFVPGAPFQVVWNITKKCNMKCVHCYESASTKAKDELSRNQVLNGIDTMAKSGVTSIAFSGGEPSIHPHIIEFIETVDDNGMFPAIATNGYIFKDEKKAENFVDNGLGFVQISLDGINPKTHDSFRKVNGAWERAVKAIKNFVDLGIFVEVSTTVTEHNIKEIPDMINFLKELKVDWFMLYNFIPTGNGSEISSLDISPEKREKLLMKAYQENTDKMQILSTAPQYAAVAESINSKRNRLNGNFTSFEVNSNKNNYKNIYENNNKNNYEYTNENNYENNDENNSENRYEDNNEYLNFKNEIYDEANNEQSVIPTHFYNPEYTNPMIAQLAEFIGGCGAGRFYINIEPNGDIYPCVFFPHEEEVKIGNIIYDDFDEMWRENPLLKQLRNKELLKGNCGNCESNNICGGCRARAYNYFKDVLAPDPGCIKNEREWEILKTKISEEEKLKINEIDQEKIILELKH